MNFGCPRFQCSVLCLGVEYWQEADAIDECTWEEPWARGLALWFLSSYGFSNKHHFLGFHTFLQRQLCHLSGRIERKGDSEENAWSTVNKFLSESSESYATLAASFR